MSEQCNGQWHNYPDCDDCPMLGDTCDGSEEWNEDVTSNVYGQIVSIFESN